ncbi:replication protein [Staphylococcus sp. HMSC068D08]|uniref:phage replisome organizer N-terminal domain-containing protein n=1 Tax=Staphylococcus TaxID=1279 RepID=UPI0008A4B29B|nr:MULTISPECIES: phage replisome organizer N-terminal domain-containing protein [Staphylococcus]ARJ30552.1 replication protein [Staphylococcus lugdunensis]MCH8639793.1 phage replisome organizer N-terminal domain-containing protein [Staphylococcus lugdunensis]MCH8678322.1 phage replisome organizer N-terminal domain-containing protein [Staphylococcus lugdunensis]MDU1964181.1 phage replisome organizer N-terminal domain-containing protein [Staphylococcus lugdunensis]OFM44913.1 replication protein 
MAEVSWIKLKVGMFDDSKIKYIEALPERDTIITLWVKLLTLAGKYNEQGYIMLSENLPYNEEMLANEFNRPINSIRLALQTFKTLGMIEDVNGVFKVTNWEKHQNIEGLEKIREQNRLRKRKQRNKQKLLDSHVKSRDSHATDKEEDKELEEDKEIDKEDVFKNSINYIMNNLDKNLTPNQMQQIGYAIDDIGKYADEVVEVATDYTKDKGCHAGYLIKVLNNWAKENVKTKEDAENKIKPKNKKSAADDLIAQMEKELGDES